MTALPSSVCDGLGVYALKPIAKDTPIGHYPGVLLNDEEHTLMWARLQRWKSAHGAAAVDRARIAELEREHGLKVQPPASRSDRVNWQGILEALDRYSFLTDDNGTLVPECYAPNGTPLWQPENHRNGEYDSLTPFFNEAPPGAFINLLTGRVQRSAYHVEVESVGNKVFFQTRQSVAPGQEMFVFYGPFYERDYEVNLDPFDCDFAPHTVSEDDPDAGSREYREFFAQQSQFRKRRGGLDRSPPVRRIQAMNRELDAVFDFYTKNPERRVKRHRSRALLVDQPADLEAEYAESV